jgi:hypothetical protein
MTSHLPRPHSQCVASPRWAPLHGVELRKHIRHVRHHHTSIRRDRERARARARAEGKGHTAGRRGGMGEERYRTRHMGTERGGGERESTRQDSVSFCSSASFRFAASPLPRRGSPTPRINGENGTGEHCKSTPPAACINDGWQASRTLTSSRRWRMQNFFSPIVVKVELQNSRARLR